MPRCVFALLLSLACQTVFAAEDLTVLSTSPDGTPAGKLLEVSLKQQFSEMVAARTEAFQAIKSKADCERWQQERRDFFIRQIGGLPERTPLNAKIVGRLEADDYRVENILFESLPGFYVTGNLYLPKTPGPYPGVIVPCGHSHNGKASGGYQRASILLAKHGMAAFCYDPVGQGERYQILDFEHEHEHFASVSYPLAVPHPRVQFLCTVEHTMMGLGCTLLGGNVAQYRIWDGMRAIDYLQSRPDIIADKIGCTGNSGGGTLTAYLMALDDRIVAAAPICYLTTFQRLIETRGPQDGEQNIFAQISFGMDEPDYVMMRAPRPTLVCAGRRDVTFNIDGTWDLFRQSKEFYSRLGFPERVAIHDADIPHGFYIQQREAAARWMHRWLMGRDKTIQEVDPATLPDPLSDKELYALNVGDWTQEELYGSPEGQVLLMDSSRSVFEINAERESGLRKERTAKWEKLAPAARRELVRSTIGGRSIDADEKASVEARVVGTIERDGYTIEKLVLTRPTGIPLPALAFVPDNKSAKQPTGEVCLYLHGVSLQADAAAGGPIEQLVRSGKTVLAAELSGIGETETGHDKRDYGQGKFGRDVQEIYVAYLMGRSYVGMRVDDISDWNRFARTYRATSDKPNTISLIAIGEAAIPALHAAAVRPDDFATVELRQMIGSWAEVVQAPQTFDQAVNMVHGVLHHYDLPDLVELAGEQRIRIENRVDAMGQPIAATQQGATR